LKAQGFDRNKLPYKGWFQPYSAYIGLGWMTFIVFTYGYSAFKPWSVDNFFINYTMLMLSIVLFIGWKVIHKTKFVKPHELDLVWEAPAIDAYEATFYDEPLGFWREMIPFVKFKSKNGQIRSDARRGSVN
jgi:amino acid transporter